MDYKEILTRFYEKYPNYNIKDKFIKNPRNLLCKCGEFKKTKKNGVLSGYCGKKECHWAYNKKRPKHSETMKKLAKEGKISSLKKKGFSNPFLNSLEFKKKRLENLGIETKKLSSLDINSIFKKEVSKTALNTETLRKKAITLYEKFEKEFDIQFIDRENLDTCNRDYLKKCLIPLNSIKTLVSNKNGKGLAKKFKRIRKTNFKYNDTVEELTTRSSYESNYIDFFERNKIRWEYETLYIPCDENRKYLPDFVFEFADQKYVLEVKGFLLDEEEYFNKKIRYAIKYCKENNMKFLFSYKPKPKNIEELLKEEVKFT